jgi:hypothetical protein
LSISLALFLISKREILSSSSSNGGNAIVKFNWFGYTLLCSLRVLPSFLRYLMLTFISRSY